MTTTADSAGLDDLAEQTWSVLGALARVLQVKDAELQPTLDAIVVQAVEVIAPAEHAGLILLQRGRLVPLSTAGEPPRILDLWQQQHGAGPCIEAAMRQQLVQVEDTGAEPRWPDFAERAQALAVASMLCLPLWVNDQRLGTLSLYGAKPHAFEEHHVQLTGLYAAHAAVALVDAQRSDQLKAAMVNRDLIGQAKGILIERHRLTPDAAFGCLSSASQRANVKLLEVARHLVETGELLGAGSQP